MAKVNCAIYTRKSNERGLDSQFSSLQSQEEACKAYIQSQAFNGWQYYKTFEDGGLVGVQWTGLDYRLCWKKSVLIEYR